MQTTSPAFGPGTFAHNLFTRTSKAFNKEVSSPSDTNAEEDGDDEQNAELDEQAGERTRRHHQRGRARTATFEATLTTDDDHGLRPSFQTEITVENLAQTVGEDVFVAVNTAMRHERKTLLSICQRRRRRRNRCWEPPSWSSSCVRAIF